MSFVTQSYSFFSLSDEILYFHYGKRNCLSVSIFPGSLLASLEGNHVCFCLECQCGRFPPQWQHSENRKRRWLQNLTTWVYKFLFNTPVFIGISSKSNPGFPKAFDFILIWVYLTLFSAKKKNIFYWPCNRVEVMYSRPKCLFYHSQINLF